MAIAHLTIEFRFGNECGDRVYDQYINGAGANKGFGNFERLLAVVWLRDQQVIDIDAQLLRINRIESVLCIDERRHAAGLLGFGDYLKRDRRFAGRFRAEDFNDASPRKATDAESSVEGDRSSRNDRDRHDSFLRSKPHDRSLTELLFNLR